jgi:hypothetical protein
MRKSLLIFIAIFLLNGNCEKFPERKYIIRVRNNSDQTIAIFAGYFSDTLLPETKPDLKEIASGESGVIYDSEVEDEKFERLNTERITVFILNNDTVNMRSWKELKINYNILKRYKFNNQELNDMGGAIIYP